MSAIRPAHYTFASTADLATYCEMKAEEAHRRRMSSTTQRDGHVFKAVKDVYTDLASLIRDADFESEIAAEREP